MIDKNADAKTRKVVADHLYLDRGPQEASSRCDGNTSFGKVDLCDEMLARLELKPGQSVVDVGCGSGQHLARFAEAVGPTGSARGFDFSPGAVEKTRARGLTADVADGAVLPVPGQSFDALASSFAVYYLADVNKTVTEWYRVLRDGGRMVCSGPADDTNAEFYDFHRAITGHGPADTDLMALGFVQAMDGPMKQAGFADVRIDTFTNPITYPTIDDFIAYWSNTSIFARTVADDARDATIAKGREQLAGRDSFVITKRVSVAVGFRR